MGQSHGFRYKLHIPKMYTQLQYINLLFVYGEVLRPSQSNGVMSSAVSLSNHTFTGQA